MATVINNPGSTTDNSSSGLIIGVLVLILVIIGLVYFGSPYMRGTFGSPSGSAPTNIENNVQRDETPDGGTQINVPEVNIPEKIDVNVENK